MSSGKLFRLEESSQIMSRVRVALMLAAPDGLPIDERKPSPLVSSRRAVSTKMRAASPVSFLWCDRKAMCLLEPAPSFSYEKVSSRSFTSPSSLLSAACGVKGRCTTPRSATSASSSSIGVLPCSCSKSAVVRQRISASLLPVYALSPNAASRPRSSSSRLTRKCPVSRSSVQMTSEQLAPISASTSAPMHCVPSSAGRPETTRPSSWLKKPTAMTPHKPQAPCTEKALTTSSTFSRRNDARASE
mmetsp:Transcript_25418/g.84645  ORF Transcript_25418/g.84645 Transcript_25418/m.84645 type:complete len:245 (+) Transcript_25418:1165-1899(+)